MSMKITLVKKILPDGRACRKCQDVHTRPTESGWLEKIDEVLEARQSDPESRGMRLARQYQVTQAPLLIVERARQPALAECHDPTIRQSPTRQRREPTR